MPNFAYLKSIPKLYTDQATNSYHYIGLFFIILAIFCCIYIIKILFSRFFTNSLHYIFL